MLVHVVCVVRGKNSNKYTPPTYRQRKELQPVRRTFLTGIGSSLPEINTETSRMDKSPKKINHEENRLMRKGTAPKTSVQLDFLKIEARNISIKTEKKNSTKHSQRAVMTNYTEKQTNTANVFFL